MIRHAIVTGWKPNPGVLKICYCNELRLRNFVPRNSRWSLLGSVLLADDGSTTDSHIERIRRRTSAEPLCAAGMKGGPILQPRIEHRSNTDKAGVLKIKNSVLTRDSFAQVLYRNSSFRGDALALDECCPCTLPRAGIDCGQR